MKNVNRILGLDELSTKSEGKIYLFSMGIRNIFHIRGGAEFYSCDAMSDKKRNVITANSLNPGEILVPFSSYSYLKCVESTSFDLDSEKYFEKFVLYPQLSLYSYLKCVKSTSFESGALTVTVGIGKEDIRHALNVFRNVSIDFIIIYEALKTRDANGPVISNIKALTKMSVGLIFKDNRENNDKIPDIKYTLEYD